MEVTDNVIPASNSEMARNLFLLSLYFENKIYGEQAIQLTKNVADDVKKNLNYYSNWAQAIILQIHSPHEIAIVGKDWKEKLSEFHKNYLPGVIYSGGEEEGSLSLLENKLIADKTMIYVCKNKTCGMPVEEASDALKQIRG